MRRQIGRIGLKLGMLLLIPYLCVGIVFCFPMRFFDSGYAVYKHNIKYAESHDVYCRVLIMGDSTAKAAWMPDVLSSDTYNLALSAASAIEEYYRLRDYLQKNAPPEYLIYMQNISSYLELDHFWNRPIYFHSFGWNQFKEFLDDVKEYNDLSIFGGGLC